jgi:geranylgeranyl pyrophosphate synthase
MNTMHLQLPTDSYQRKLIAVRQDLKEILQESILSLDLLMDDLLHLNEETFPLLLLLSSDISKASSKTEIRAATIIEILLMATRVHRKISDPSPTLQQTDPLRKDQMIILTGDYLYAKALSLAAQESVLLVKGISEMIQSLVIAGVVLQNQSDQEEADDHHNLVNTYYHAANLSSICCRLGAQIGSASPELIRSLSSYGFSFGMATQIKMHIASRQGQAVSKSSMADRSVRIVTYSSSLIKQYIHKAKRYLTAVPPCQARDRLAYMADHLLAGTE